MSVGADHLEAAQGWTLEQALELTADHQLWDTWIAATAGTSSATAARLLRGEMRAQPVAETFNKIKAQLRDQLVRGTLRARGCRGSPGAVATPIYPAAWSTLRIVDLQRSIVLERGQTAIVIYNVRIYPVIHFDEAIEELRAFSLAEAFRKFVLEDPEVVTSQKRIPDRKRYEDVFVEGQAPGPMVSFQWPLELTSDDLAYEFVRPLFISLYSPLPKPPAAIRHLAKIIVDRWQRLRERLIAGQIIARGTFARTGMVQYLDHLQWARQGLSVDVKSGDLIEFEDHKPVVRWSGLSLSGPRSIQTFPMSLGTLQSDTAVEGPDPTSEGPDEGHSIPRASERSSNHRRRPMADAVARALKESELDQSQGERSLKQIAAIIAPTMPKPPKTEAEMLALAKAVKRYYEELEAQSR